LNDDLLIASKVRPNLIRDKDYLMVNEKVWQKLHKVYGGGPPIARTTEDIYSVENRESLESEGVS